MNYKALSIYNSTRSGTWTRTAITGQRILSPSCLPFHHSGILYGERKTRLELATLTLARLCSTNWAISAFGFNGCKDKYFSFISQILHPFSFYLSNNERSASSIPSKLKPFTTSSIKFEICSLQRLPMLPSWVWCTCLSWVKFPASISNPTFL